MNCVLISCCFIFSIADPAIGHADRNTKMFPFLPPNILTNITGLFSGGSSTPETTGSPNETQEAPAESGICSYYGEENEIAPGAHTACGDLFDRFAFKTAHRTLPCGTRVRITNTRNGKTVDADVNERGPNKEMFPERILDLTYAAFGRVEEYSKGTFPCSYEII